MKRNLTTQQFHLIADCIRTLPSFATSECNGNRLSAIGPIEVVYWDVVVNRFAEMLQTTNPRFNKDRFIADCHGRGDV